MRNRHTATFGAHWAILAHGRVDRATFPGPGDAGDPGGTIGLGGLATCVEIRSALSARAMFYRYKLNY